MNTRSRRHHDATISISPATLSVARVKVPGTDIEAITVVGEMAMPADLTGPPSRRMIAIGTTVEQAGVEVVPSADVRYLVVDAQPNQSTRGRGRGNRRQRSSRREPQ